MTRRRLRHFFFWRKLHEPYEVLAIWVAVAAVFVAVLVLSTVTTALWWRGVLEARRADAKHLFLEGKVNVDYYPVGSFSNAVESLEMVDDPDVRRFALEALWRSGVDPSLARPGVCGCFDVLFEMARVRAEGR